MTTRTVSVALKAAVSNYVTGMRKAADETSRTEKAIHGLRSVSQQTWDRVGAAGVVAAGALAYGAKQAVDAASDLQESMSKSAVVFGQQAAAMETWADTSAEAFGQSKQQALEAAASFGNLFVSMGMGQAPAAAMSRSLVQLASDLASFNNSSPQEALDALRSGLVGETEPLRRFGVNLNDATLSAKALEMGLVSTTSGALPAAAKAQAAYALILEQTGTAQGDFARTSDGLANQQRILAAEFDNAKAQLGQDLLPLMKDLVSILNGTLGVFRDLPEPVRVAAEVLTAVGVAAMIAVPRIIAMRDALTSIGGAGALAGKKGALGIGLLTTALITLKSVSSGMDGGALWTPFRSSFESVEGLNQALKDTIQPGLGGRVQNAFTGIADALGILEDRNNAARRAIEQQDAALAQMVSEGRTDEARALYAEIAARAGEWGANQAELNELFPQFAAALGLVGSAADSAGQSLWADNGLVRGIQALGAAIAALPPVPAGITPSMVGGYAGAVMGGGMQPADTYDFAAATQDEQAARLDLLDAQRESQQQFWSDLRRAEDELRRAQQALAAGPQWGAQFLRNQAAVERAQARVDAARAAARDEARRQAEQDAAEAARRREQWQAERDQAVDEARRTRDQVLALLPVDLAKTLSTASADEINTTLGGLIAGVRDAFTGALEDQLVSRIHATNVALAAKAKERDRIARELQDAQGRLDDLQSQRTSTAEAVSSGARGDVTGMPASGYAVTRQLTRRLATIQRLAADIKTLAKRGLPTWMLRQIVDAAGSDLDGAAAMAAALARMPETDWRKLVDIASQVDTAAQNLGESAAGALFDKPIADAQTTVDKLMGEQDALEEEMRKLGEAMAAALRQALTQTPITVTVQGRVVTAPAQGRAAGGPVHAGRSYLVGEKGPELLTVGGTGWVTPNRAVPWSAIARPATTSTGGGFNVGGITVNAAAAERASEALPRALKRVAYEITGRP